MVYDTDGFSSIFLMFVRAKVTCKCILYKQYDEDEGTSNYIEKRKLRLQEAHRQARAATKASKKSSSPIMTKEPEQQH